MQTAVAPDVADDIISMKKEDAFYLEKWQAGGLHTCDMIGNRFADILAKYALSMHPSRLEEEVSTASDLHALFVTFLSVAAEALAL